MQITNKGIRTVLKDIENGHLILPALQREFVWKRRDIENLFDSLLQGFPINTLMFWNVSDIKTETMEFYRFLDADYKEGVSTNQIYSVRDNDRKTIVIDGQQRLTSLWIAVYGSYTSEKGKNKMYLYLNLDGQLKNGDSEDDSINSTDNYYNFRFMAESKADNLIANGEHWIKVSDAYSQDFNPVNYILEHHLNDNKFAQDTLQKLADLFRNETILNAYEITDENLQHVLNVFVRTNSGGKPLTKGDLLLSMVTVNWAGGNRENAREYVQGIVNVVADYGYKVDKDWVLSCILYILGKNIKLSVDNFDKATSERIYHEKENIFKSIEATCRLLNSFGMLERGLTTKLALLPIVYHIFNHNLASKVCTFKKGQMESIESGIYVDMRTWLFRAIVKGFFTSGTNDKLTKIQKIQSDKGKADYFPVTEIISEVSSLSINLNVNDELIDELMATEKKNAFSVLNIIYSSSRDMSFLEAKTEYDIDHIHAQAQFDKNSGDNRYDTIANLQLLNFRENRSKNDTSLQEWWNGKSDGEKRNYLLPKTFNTQIAGFDDFFNGRSRWLKGILAEKLDAKESQYAGIYLEEKVLAAVYREGREKYSLCWTIHEDKVMQMPLKNGILLNVAPNHNYAYPMLALSPLTDDQRKALETEGLAKESFFEMTNKWNHSLIHEGAFGICFGKEDDMQARVAKVFKTFDLLLEEE